MKHKIQEERLAKHNRTVLFLDTLALLLGCKESFGSILPDGKRPDVLRIDFKRELLFMGDAKNTESPCYKETQIQLIGYLRWLSSHITEEHRVGIFAISFPNKRDAVGWQTTILLLAQEIDLICFEHAINAFGPELNTAWFIFRYNPTKTRCTTYGEKA